MVQATLGRPLILLLLQTKYHLVARDLTLTVGHGATPQLGTVKTAARDFPARGASTELLDRTEARCSLRCMTSWAVSMSIAAGAEVELEPGVEREVREAMADKVAVTVVTTMKRWAQGVPAGRVERVETVVTVRTEATEGISQFCSLTLLATYLVC
jgi:hypothetical protein